uniref:EamA domain-containing protein n=1 Tax=Chromera velia CCMP2878 TaxID=1169474 RepID=A0A0G4HCU9_9ALVE|eukprot:Cvel_954.t1-p1 / transcript=Cvel_954.t1 / gene=Cvel_954 / organism=Chromera_velia_CCMP2878 / gene_product=Solute carrier family 35 member G1, putative / transcript_product=Solute carrier family 35 member G1, putative / location=Cvel_scaffold30:162236-165932(+) / protein_length=863 / sequence_SO=supercontig / SO=protein_coding / is_pseudo=false
MTLSEHQQQGTEGCRNGDAATGPYARMGTCLAALRSLAGLLCAALGAFSFALMSLTAEIASPHLGSAFLLMIVRGVVQIVLSVSVFYGNRLLFKGKGQGGREDDGGILGPRDARFWLYIGRGLIGGTSAVAYLFVLTQLPLGDASALNSSGTLVAAALGWFWLRERWHWLNWVAGVATVVGAFIIARPSFLAPVLGPVGLVPSDLDAQDDPMMSRPLAVVFGLFAAVASATGLAVIRKFRHVAFPVTVFVHSVASGGIALLILVCWDRMRPSVEDLKGIPLGVGWGFAVLTGVLGFSMQCLYTLALVFEQAGPSLFAMTLDTPISFVLQALVLGTSLGTGSLVGGALIVASVLLLLATKLYCVQPPGPVSESGERGQQKGEEGDEGGLEMTEEGRRTVVEEGGRGLSVCEDEEEQEQEGEEEERPSSPVEENRGHSAIQSPPTPSLSGIQRGEEPEGRAAMLKGDVLEERQLQGTAWRRRRAGRGEFEVEEDSFIIDEVEVGRPHSVSRQLTQDTETPSLFHHNHQEQPPLLSSFNFFETVREETLRGPRVTNLLPHFEAIAAGLSQLPSTDPTPSPDFLRSDPDYEAYYRVFKDNFGVFYKHLCASIPFFLEEQIRLGVAISRLALAAPVSVSLSDGPFTYYETSAADGTQGRSLGEYGDGRIQALTDSPNPANRDTFRRLCCHSRSRMHVGPWCDVTPEFLSRHADMHVFSSGFDLIFENTTFQMYGPKRGDQIAYVKRVMKPGGLLILSEKLLADCETYSRQEEVKNRLFKSRYLSTKAIDEKKTQILGDMERCQVDLGTLVGALRSHFNHAYLIWNSTNFYEVVASDDKHRLDLFVSFLGPLYVPPPFLFEETPVRPLF